MRIMSVYYTLAADLILRKMGFLSARFLACSRKSKNLSIFIIFFPSVLLLEKFFLSTLHNNTDDDTSFACRNDAVHCISHIYYTSFETWVLLQMCISSRLPFDLFYINLQKKSLYNTLVKQYFFYYLCTLCE